MRLAKNHKIIVHFAGDCDYEVTRNLKISLHIIGKCDLQYAILFNIAIAHIKRVKNI